MINETKLQYASVKRLMQRAVGGRYRIAANAVERMNDYICEELKEICRKATTYVEHTGRKTIKAKDVEAVLSSRGEDQNGW